MNLNYIEKYKINQLAAAIYQLHGYEPETGYDFSKATHPQEELMWAVALYSYKYWVISKEE